MTVSPNFKSGKKKPKVPTKTQDLKKCDQLFSLIIRARDGRCQECGSTDGLQNAHGFSRSYRATRFDRRQCWALCIKCHKRYTHRPIEWSEWMVDRMGEALYEEVRTLAKTGPNPDLRELRAALQQEWDQVQKEAA